MPGTTRIWRGVKSRFLEHARDVVIWLPPGYDSPAEATRHYPVLFMHDGQNLIDPATSFAGVDWGIDDALDDLIGARKVSPMIVVGPYNSPRRMQEYDPAADGENYARFLLEELKPRVDRQLRTLPGPEHTGVGGSSMGGLISLYLGWKHPDVFGKVMALSVHFSIHEGQLASEIISSGSYPRSVRLYMDRGTEGIDAGYAHYLARMTSALKQWGWQEGEDFVALVAEGAEHNEAAWRTRAKAPLEWLFGTAKTP